MLRCAIHIVLLLCFIAGNGEAAFCQQGMFFSNYIQDATAFNPAYAGSQGALTISAQHRHQWVGASGAPASQGISVHTPVWSNKMGVGFRVTNDQLAGFGQQTLASSLAYRINFSEKRFIAAGLQLAFVRQFPEFFNLLILDPDDPAFGAGQAAFSAAVGAGVYYASENFYAGFAVPELFSDLGGRFQEQVYRAPERAYIAHTGIMIKINHDIKLKPNALLVIPENGVLYADANLMMLFREVLWIGSSYRLGQGISALAQIQLNTQLAVGYSYDLPAKERGALGVSSHEISVQYRFYFVKSDVKSPRYF